MKHFNTIDGKLEYEIGGKMNRIYTSFSIVTESNARLDLILQLKNTIYEQLYLNLESPINQDHEKHFTNNQ